MLLLAVIVVERKFAGWRQIGPASGVKDSAVCPIMELAP